VATVNGDVTPADRWRIHRLIIAADQMSNGRRDGKTRALVAATYWESFPTGYSPEQINAARRVHVCAVGSAAWEQALADVTRLAGS
jgi:hypothetical protein